MQSCLILPLRIGQPSMDVYMKAMHQRKMLDCSFNVDNVARYKEKLKMGTAGLYQVIFDEDGFVGVDQDKLDDCNNRNYAVAANSKKHITVNTKVCNHMKYVKCGNFDRTQQGFHTRRSELFNRSEDE